MKKEDLFDAIGEIRSETIEKNDITAGSKKNIRAVRMTTWLVAAAVLALIVLAGGSTYRLGIQRKSLQKAESPATEMVAAEAVEEECEEECAEEVPLMDNHDTAVCGVTEDETYPADGIMESGASAEKESQEKYVSINEFFLVGDVSVEEVQRIETVKVGRYTAQYECRQDAIEEVIKDSVGQKWEDDEEWYRVSGHDEIQYLIHVSGGKYTLWRFMYFLSEEYPFKDVLEMIYGIESADQIEAVAVYPPVPDNMGGDKGLQGEISMRYITDTADLQNLFDVLSRMTCYGRHRGELMDNGVDDLSSPATKAERCLDFFLKDGDVMGTLKYTAVSGMFYENDGAAYSRLSAQDKDIIEKMLLGIEE